MELDTSLSFEFPKNTAVVDVNLPGSPYKIIISSGALSHLGAILQSDEIHPRIVAPTKTLLVTNQILFDLYGHKALHSLGQAGFQVCHHVVPEGEYHKTLDTMEGIFDTALRNRMDRASLIIALGGGVVGDMAGFAAACWMRGIGVVQIPTSLLAMVDSAIGGKTGVNHPKGKNLIGAFHQPRMVLIDPTILKTLPGKEFQAGLGEVIKYGVILDKELFLRLEAMERLDNTMSSEDLEYILYRSAKAKADVVSKDEKESGLRALLNYGHTVGHAIEALCQYQGIIHGEAVAIGMVAAASIALKLNMIDEDLVTRQLALIKKGQLPYRIPKGLTVKNILETLKTDKKIKNGRIHFALPTQLGKGVVTDWASIEHIEEVLEPMVTKGDAGMTNGHVGKGMNGHSNGHDISNGHVNGLEISNGHA